MVRALAERRELKMDYRAAAAAAYLGLGATWAMGLSSSAAQLQANASSLPQSLLPITGVIPFSQTIFLWQSIVITVVLIAVSWVIAVWSAPGRDTAKTAEDMGVDVSGGDAIVVVVAPVDDRVQDDRQREHPAQRGAQARAAAATSGVSHGSRSRPPRTC